MSIGKEIPINGRNLPLDPITQKNGTTYTKAHNPLLEAHQKPLEVDKEPKLSKAGQAALEAAKDRATIILFGDRATKFYRRPAKNRKERKMQEALDRCLLRG